MAASPPHSRHSRAEPGVSHHATADPIPAALHEITSYLHLLAHELRALRDVVEQLAPERTPHDLTTYSGERDPSGAAAPALQLRLYCLGAFAVFIGEQPLQRRHVGKGWAILKVLAGRPDQPIHREVLIEALWPQTEPEVANNRLRVAVHHLRQSFLALPAENAIGSVIRFRNGCYMFDPALDLWCDVAAFRAAWEAGRAAERDAQDALAVQRYREALALYQGDFLAEDCYEEWTLAPREALKDIFLSILDRLGQHALRTGAFADAVAHWRTLITHAPWREDIYRRLMVSCALSGQRCQALHWYALCQQILDEQLAILPEPETVQLYERILAGDTPGIADALS
jgi:DNA-binding SARP family transcriptional activator